MYTSIQHQIAKDFISGTNTLDLTDVHVTYPKYKLKLLTSLALASILAMNFQFSTKENCGY